MYGIVNFVLRGHRLKFLNYDVFMSLKIVFIMANSTLYHSKQRDPDEMPHKVAFHLGLHCLPRYLFTGI